MFNLKSLKVFLFAFVLLFFGTFTQAKTASTAVPDLTLNNGIAMPQLGFGTLTLKGDVTKNSVKQAIKSGYRLIDTAKAYGNEDAVGLGIKNSGIKREELFITTKINFGNFEKEDCEKAVKDSFEKLQVDYIDMVLLHWPFGNTYAGQR